MATSDYTLSSPPSDPRQLELWLQHAAGFILFEDMRDYATQRIDPGLGADAQATSKGHRRHGLGPYDDT